MNAIERIDTSLRLFDKPVGDIRLYKRALAVAEGDEDLTDTYCLSKHGGFTESQLKRIKYKINWNKRKYQSSKKLKLDCI